MTHLGFVVFGTILGGIDPKLLVSEHKYVPVLTTNIHIQDKP